MEAKRALVIRAGSVRRLTADYVSYAAEHRQHSASLLRAQQSGDSHAAGKQREFVDECSATMMDIRHRLSEAAQQLQAFMSVHTELVGSPEWEKAQQLLNSSSVHAEAAAAAEGGGATEAAGALPDGLSAAPALGQSIPSPRFSVAVYGGSQVQAGDAVYEEAERLGRRLAEEDFHIVSGGYGGVMEAVSAGGASVPGSSVEGILSPAAFPLQSAGGNRFLTQRTLTSDLPQRVVAFLRRCQAFVVMPGGLGTLTELCLTWDVSAVAAMRQQGEGGGEQAGSSERPLCLLLYRRPWEAVVASLSSQLPIPASFLARIRFVDGSEDVLQAVQQARAAYQADIKAPLDRQHREAEDEKS